MINNNACYHLFREAKQKSHTKIQKIQKFWTVVTSPPVSQRILTTKNTEDTKGFLGRKARQSAEI